MKIADQITSAIIGALEAGTVPWQRPFPFGSPLRSCGKRYRGINALWLNHQQQTNQYNSPYWFTMPAGNKLGGTVRPGQKATIATFYKKMAITNITNEGDDTDDTDDNCVVTTRPFMFMKGYYVFNASQFDGLPEKYFPPKSDGMELLASAQCEAIVNGYPHPPTLVEAISTPSYRPSTDTVTMPPMATAVSVEAYYSTLFHELVHSTGHTSRLDRLSDSAFGTPEYAKEELTAEIGACLLCAAAGIAPNIDNSAAYIHAWLTALKNDKSLVIRAASLAQKASDHILNVVWENQPTEIAAATTTA